MQSRSTPEWGADPQPSAQLSETHPDAADANAGARRSLTGGQHAADALSVVGNNDMQSSAKAPHVDGHPRGRSVPVGVGQSFLHDAQDRSLHKRWVLGVLAVHSNLAEQPRTIGEAADVGRQRVVQALLLQGQWMHEIAEGRSSLIASCNELSAVATAFSRLPPVLLAHGAQDKACGDEVLHCRVVKLQRDAAPFLLLNGEKALRKPVRLAFYPLAGRDVGNDADKPGRSLVRGILVLGVNLDPALVSTAALDAERRPHVGWCIAARDRSRHR